jgi:ankyrin repeat protein
MKSVSLLHISQEGDLESVKAHLEVHPGCVRERNPKSGQLPIQELLCQWEHLANTKVSSKVGYCDLVGELIRLYPYSLFVTDDEGNTPLHQVVKIDSQYGRDAFDLIYNGAKCISSYRNDAGQLPVHIAIERGRHDYVKVFIQQDYCTMNADVNGLLRHAIAYNVRSDVIVELIRENPFCATKPDLDGLLPIQYTLTHGNASPSVIEALCNAYPESLCMPDKDGELTLHLAAGYYRGHDESDRVCVLRQIGQAYPPAYSTENQNGQLPLHLAVIYESQVADNRQSVRSLQAVASGFPSAYETPDCDGNFPLHVACGYYQADLSILTFLVEQNPIGLRTVNYNGCFPMHIAAHSNLPVAALKYLIDRYPQSLQRQDCEGNLPLHHAILRECFQVESVEVLLEECPASARHANHKGDLPLHVACANRSPHAILDLLIQAYPHAQVCCNAIGRLPLLVRCPDDTLDLSDSFSSMEQCCDSWS